MNVIEYRIGPSLTCALAETALRIFSVPRVLQPFVCGSSRVRFSQDGLVWKWESLKEQGGPGWPTGSKRLREVMPWIRCILKKGVPELTCSCFARVWPHECWRPRTTQEHHEPCHLRSGTGGALVRFGWQLEQFLWQPARKL